MMIDSDMLRLLAIDTFTQTGSVPIPDNLNTTFSDFVGLTGAFVTKMSVQKVSIKLPIRFLGEPFSISSILVIVDDSSKDKGRKMFHENHRI